MAQAIYIYIHVYSYVIYIYIYACVFHFGVCLPKGHVFSNTSSVNLFLHRQANAEPSSKLLGNLGCVLSKLEDVNHVIDSREHPEQTIVFTIKLGCSAYVSLKQIHCVRQSTQVNPVLANHQIPPVSQCKWGMFHDQIKLSGVR